MNRSFPLAAVLLLSLGFLSGCASLFLLSKVEDPLKSKALTEQGILLYQLYLVNRGEYDRVAEVRRYFVVALRYDPENLKAQQYLDRVDNYRSAEAGKRVREAEQYLKKAKRSADEDYALCLAVQRANLLNPQNDEVVRLRRETTEIRVTLVETYIESTKASVAQAKTATPEPAREKLYIEAFRSVNRVLAIDPLNSSAQAEKSSMRPELNGIVAKRLQAARQKIDKSQFAEARKDVQLLEELNRKLERAFDRQVTDLGYTLNYRWAKALFDRKDYASSEAKAAAAIAIRKTDEATALKSKAAQARARAETGGSFEAGLAQADKLIEQGDWAGAWRKIDALSKSTKDRGSLASLENRRERVRAQLPALYEKAVGLYKAEDFAKAIELLETVLKIDVDYEQAAEYMDKAKAKQKLIEQYGGDA